MCVCVCSVVSNSLWHRGLYVSFQAPLAQGVFQAKILKWIAIFLLQGIFQPRESTLSLESTALACRFFTTRATLHSVGHSLLSSVWHSLLDSFQACNVTQHLPPWRCYLDGTYSLSHLPEETSFKEIFIKAISNFNSYSLFFYFLIFELKIKFLTYTIKKPHLKIMCNGIFKIFHLNF